MIQISEWMMGHHLPQDLGSAVVHLFFVSFVRRAVVQYRKQIGAATASVGIL